MQKAAELVCSTASFCVDQLFVLAAAVRSATTTSVCLTATAALYLSAATALSLSAAARC
jgi:hypothetical protein